MTEVTKQRITLGLVWISFFIYADFVVADPNKVAVIMLVILFGFDLLLVITHIKYERKQKELDDLIDDMIPDDFESEIQELLDD